MAEWWVEHKYEDQVFFESYSDLEGAQARVEQLVDYGISPDDIKTEWPEAGKE